MVRLRRFGERVSGDARAAARRRLAGIGKEKAKAACLNVALSSSAGSVSASAVKRVTWRRGVAALLAGGVGQATSKSATVNVIIYAPPCAVALRTRGALSALWQR